MVIIVSLVVVQLITLHLGSSGMVYKNSFMGYIYDTMMFEEFDIRK